MHLRSRKKTIERCDDRTRQHDNHRSDCVTSDEAHEKNKKTAHPEKREHRKKCRRKVSSVCVVDVTKKTRQNAKKRGQPSCSTVGIKCPCALDPSAQACARIAPGERDWEPRWTAAGDVIGATGPGPTEPSDIALRLVDSTNADWPWLLSEPATVVAASRDDELPPAPAAASAATVAVATAPVEAGDLGDDHAPCHTGDNGAPAVRASPPVGAKAAPCDGDSDCCGWSPRKAAETAALTAGALVWVWTIIGAGAVGAGPITLRGDSVLLTGAPDKTAESDSAAPGAADEAGEMYWPPAPPSYPPSALVTPATAWLGL